MSKHDFRLDITGRRSVDCEYRGQQASCLHPDRGNCPSSLSCRNDKCPEKNGNK